MKIPAILAMMGSSLSFAIAGPQRTVYGEEPTTGMAAAVKVGSVALVHTSTMLPRKDNDIVGAGDISRQALQVLDNLDRALALGGSGLDQVVKLNFSVLEPGLIAPTRSALLRRFEGKTKPAVTLVVSQQLLPGVMISGDAVGVTTKETSSGAVVRLRPGNSATRAGPAHAAILPAGPRIYLSGKGADADIVSATNETLVEAKQVMDSIHVLPEEIVQAKVMMKNLNDAQKLEETLSVFFSGNLPALTFVERNSGKAAIEIEMIAIGKPGDAKRAPQIEYMAAPPHWPASPRFSHIARVNRGGSVYISGVYGSSGDTAEVQTVSIFKRLEELTNGAGGDFTHLAKAMYYVTGREAVVALDKIRPTVFPPNGPPAASRDHLHHVGGPGGALVIDLIAIPIEK